MTGGPDSDATLDAVAARHGFSRGAMSALAEAMRRGGGRMAQFSHPELGGMGQWSGGGMLQIGAMFDHALKSRVAAACADLAAAAASAPEMGGGGSRSAERWQSQGDADLGPGPAVGSGREDCWPTALGRPSASGSQNGLRYAYFPEARRLAIARDGRVTLYDTGRHRIFGVSQTQSRGQHLAFTADDGTVDLDRLPVVDR